MTIDFYTYNCLNISDIEHLSSITLEFYISLTNNLHLIYIPYLLKMADERGGLARFAL